jgi:hypothetical protein
MSNKAKNSGKGSNNGSKTQAPVAENPIQVMETTQETQKPAAPTNNDAILKLAKILGIDPSNLTEEQIQQANEMFGSLKAPKTSKEANIIKLTETARNHRNALSNNMFELQKLGCDPAIIAELSAEVPVMEYKTKTMKRLAKEAAEKEAAATTETTQEKAPEVTEGAPSTEA